MTMSPTTVARSSVATCSSVDLPEAMEPIHYTGPTFECEQKVFSTTVKNGCRRLQIFSSDAVQNAVSKCLEEMISKLETQIAPILGSDTAGVLNTTRFDHVGMDIATGIVDRARALQRSRSEIMVLLRLKMIFVALTGGLFLDDISNRCFEICPDALNFQILHLLDHHAVWRFLTEPPKGRRDFVASNAQARLQMMAALGSSPLCREDIVRRALRADVASIDILALIIGNNLFKDRHNLLMAKKQHFFHLLERIEAHSGMQNQKNTRAIVSRLKRIFLHIEKIKI
jgi:hypothetical protein